jgi:hypothetical protein
VFSNLLPGNDPFAAMPCKGNVSRYSATDLWLWLHYSAFQPSRHNILVSFVVGMRGTSLKRAKILVLKLKILYAAFDRLLIMRNVAYNNVSYTE